MNDQHSNQYRASPSVSQTLAVLIATVLLGSVALVGTVGQAQATPFRIVASSQA